jgi:hypothetical protein
MVDLVHLVCLVQPNKPDRPNKQEKPVGFRASRATVCGASGLERLGGIIEMEQQMAKGMTH